MQRTLWRSTLGFCSRGAGLICALILIAILICGTGCFSAYDVRTPSCERTGVPFYVKTPVYVHTTTYQVSWIRAELVLKVGDEDKNPTRISRDFDSSQLPALQKLQHRLKEEDGRAAAVGPTLADLQVERIPGNVVTSVENYVKSDSASMETLNRARNSVSDAPLGPEAKKEVAQRFVHLIDSAGDKILDSVLSEFLAIQAIPEHPVDVLKPE